MNYQQRVYQWLFRQPDPCRMREIAASMKLPHGMVSDALVRMRAHGLVTVDGSGRGAKWRVKDDSVAFFPDMRGRSEASLARLHAWRAINNARKRGGSAQKAIAHGSATIENSDVSGCGATIAHDSVEAA